jgi:uncharacterized protein GlcG (DUF336 family)
MPQHVKVLTLLEAKAMNYAAEKYAATLGAKFAVAVVDHGGHLLHLIRGDGVAPGCVDLAINKAYTAVAYGRATHDLTPLAQPGGELFGIQHSLNGRAVVFGGGVPVCADGVVIGAVGASAGTVEQDISVALAATKVWTTNTENTPVSVTPACKEVPRKRALKNKQTEHAADRRHT